MRSGIILLLFAAACSSAAEPVPRERAYDLALERNAAGAEEAALAALSTALESDPALCQRALLEPAFQSGFRDADGFRAALHEACVKHGVSSLRLVGDDEPGDWIDIEGRTVDGDGAPVAGAVVRIFATDEQGRYHPTIEGERLPRIFGTVVTDADGRFHIRTVRPGPYPGTRNARHLHLSARAGSLRLAAPQYVVFDDDPLLQEPQNEEQRGEALRIAMRVENGRSIGTLTLPLR